MRLQSVSDTMSHHSDEGSVIPGNTCLTRVSHVSAKHSCDPSNINALVDIKSFFHNSSNDAYRSSDFFLS